MNYQDTVETDPWDEFILETNEELLQARQSLVEITDMLEQSQDEVSRLTQRNAVITGHLQQVQAQLENIPKAELVKAYTASLDSQQRLLVMRSQLEKLQSEQEGMQKYVHYLETVQQIIEKENKSHKKGNNGAALLETVINSQEALRQRLSRQMHDGPAQTLSNFVVQTEIAARLFEIDPVRAKEELENLKNSAMQTFQKMRGFIFELRPMMLDDLGLYPTLDRMVTGFKEQNGIEITFDKKGPDRRLEPYLEVMIFRAAQELLENSYRHNMDLPYHIQITLKTILEDNLVTVSVSDNGKGFDPQILENCEGLGLKLIRERVDLLGGYMEIDSAVGQGAKVLFQVPALEVAVVKSA